MLSGMHTSTPPGMTAASRPSSKLAERRAWAAEQERKILAAAADVIVHVEHDPTSPLTFNDTNGEPILSYLASKGWTLYMPETDDPQLHPR